MQSEHWEWAVSSVARVYIKYSFDGVIELPIQDSSILFKIPEFPSKLIKREEYWCENFHIFSFSPTRHKQQWYEAEQYEMFVSKYLNISPRPATLYSLL